MKEIDRLRDRVEELESMLEINEPLPAWVYTKIKHHRRCVGLVLNLLLANKMVSYDKIGIVLSKDGKQLTRSTIDVYSHRARKFLRECGIEMRNVWGEGYYLLDDDRTKLRELLGR